MKKVVLYRFAALSLILAVIFGSMTAFNLNPFKPKAVAAKVKAKKAPCGCSSATDGSILNGCPSACTSPYIVNNSYISVTGTPGSETVAVTSMYVCYWNPSGTPPWSTNTYLGTLISQYRPISVPRVVYGTNSGGYQIRVTINPNGDVYFYHTGTTPVGTSCGLNFTFQR